MRQIGQITNEAMSIKPNNQSPKLNIDNNLVNYIDNVFNVLKGLFPAWRNAWGDIKIENNAKREWVKAFAENGITSSDQVDFGLRNCRKLKTDFIPSVGKFISLCKITPENLGLPDAETAFNQALAGNSIHPVIDSTVRNVGSYDIRVGVPTDKGLFKRFDYYYTIMVERFAKGESLVNSVRAAICNGNDEVIAEDPLKEINKRIAEQGVSTNAAEARRQALAKLGLRDRKEARA